MVIYLSESVTRTVNLCGETVNINCVIRSWGDFGFGGEGNMHEAHEADLVGERRCWRNIFLLVFRNIRSIQRIQLCMFDSAVCHVYCTYVDFQAQPRAFHVAHVSHATVEQAPITFSIPRKSVASVRLALAQTQGTETKRQVLKHPATIGSLWPIG
jgi:hypothetical protein